MWIFRKNNLIILPTECKKLIFLNAMFQGGRLFVGAMCVLYFLSFGLKTEDYAWIKTCQAVIFITLDIPLGYLLNRIGEYKSLILSLALGIIGAFGYLISSSFLGFLFSEIFLALSISIWPVALSSYSMRVLENYKTEGLIEKFFHFGDAISNLFVVICGSLGGLFYAFNKHVPYSFFLIFYMIAIVFTLLSLKEFEILKDERKEINNFISNLLEMKSILPFAFILFFAQFFMQPLFHYWQPLFKEKFEISSQDLSIVFVGFSLAMSTISWAYSKLTHFTILRSNLFVVTAGFVASLVYSLIAEANDFIYLLLFFSIIFGVFNLVQIAGSVLIQSKLKQNNRMIIIKYVSFFSRIGMIFSLILLHCLFANEWKIENVYTLYGVIATVVFFTYLIWIAIPKKSETTYVPEYTN